MGENETGKKFQHNGLWVYAPSIRGFMFAAVAYGGWTTQNHIDRITLAKATKTCQLYPAGAPNVVVIALGINQASGEDETTDGKAEYKAKLETIINRWTTAAEAAGYDAPLFVLLNSWQTGSTAQKRNWMRARAIVHYEIARENAEVATYDLGGDVNTTYGAYSIWQASYTSDGIHQTSTGAQKFGEMFWAVIDEAADDPSLEVLDRLNATSQGGNVGVVEAAADPLQTTAYLTTRDGQGSVAGGISIAFKLLEGPGDDGQSYDRAFFDSDESDAITGLLEVQLLRNARYVGRRGDGNEIEFTTGDDDTFELPELLGRDVD